MSGAEVMRAIADAFNAREWDRAGELMSEDVEFEDVAMGLTLSGPDAFVEYARSWATAFSDMRIETLGAISDERSAAGEFIGRGTHDGTLHTPGGPVTATGRSFEERFTWFAEVADGKLTGVRDYYNALSLMTQLGLMPEPAAAGS